MGTLKGTTRPGAASTGSAQIMGLNSTEWATDRNYNPLQEDVCPQKEALRDRAVWATMDMPL